jgi:uncharacterized membrane protein YdjX (TVP38/TMEM64 family)
MDITTTLQRYAPRVKWISIGIIALALILIARLLPLERTMQALDAWLGGLGWWGPVAFGMMYVVATVLFMPGSVLTLAAGAIFGLWLGVLLASLAATTGAGLAFLIARYLARDRVSRWARERPTFDAIDRAIGEGGWKIVALLRLSPVIPFNLQNYLYGLTPIGFWPYLLTSWLAMLPGTLMYVYLGHIAGIAVTGTRDRTMAEWVALGVGFVATIAVTVYITRLAKQKLQEQTTFIERQQETSESDTPVSDVAAAQGWPWGATIAALLALLAAGAAIYVHVYPEMVTSLLNGVLGPAVAARP